LCVCGQVFWSLLLLAAGARARARLSVGAVWQD